MIHTLVTQDLHAYLSEIRQISYAASMAARHMAHTAPEPMRSQLMTIAAAGELVSDKASAAEALDG